MLWNHLYAIPANVDLVSSVDVVSNVDTLGKYTRRLIMNVYISI